MTATDMRSSSDWHPFGTKELATQLGCPYPEWISGILEYERFLERYDHNVENELRGFIEEIIVNWWSDRWGVSGNLKVGG